MRRRAAGGLRRRWRRRRRDGWRRSPVARRDGVEVLEADRRRPAFEKTVREQMMDAVRQGIALIEGPALVGAEPRHEIDERVGAGGVDLALERGADVVDRQQVAAADEGEDRRDERVARRSMRLGIQHRRSHRPTLPKVPRRAPPFHRILAFVRVIRPSAASPSATLQAPARMPPSSVRTRAARQGPRGRRCCIPV